MSKRTARPPVEFDYGFAAHWGGTQPYSSSERKEYNRKLVLERARLNRGGYTSSGKYFGTGAQLFRVLSDEGDAVDFYIRSKDRAAAKALVRTGYPNAVLGR